MSTTSQIPNRGDAELPDLNFELDWMLPTLSGLSSAILVAQIALS